MKQIHAKTGRSVVALIAAATILAGCADEPLTAPTDDASAPPAFGAVATRQGKIAYMLEPSKSLFVRDLGQPGPTLLTTWPEPSIQANPMLSPDGKYLAYLTDVENLSGDLNLYVMLSNGSTGWQVLDLPGAQSNPVWSADGRRIAFASEHAGNVEIFVVNVDGSGLTQLTNDPGVDIPGSWSRAGLYFESTRTGDREIYRMNADGTGVTRLTTSAGDDARPRIAPRGRQILFETVRDGNLELYVMNADGTNPVRLTNHTAKDHMGAWAPSGKHIVFISNRNYGADYLWMMNADGSEPFVYDASVAGVTSPSWSR